MEKDVVFISYAQEDAQDAERLCKLLREANINAWIDSQYLLPGQFWQREMTSVIRNISYLILLISNNALDERGFVQNEIKQAYTVLSSVPNNQIFVIPVRLDNSVPFDEELKNLSWVDLFPDFESGIQRLLQVLSNLQRTPRTCAVAESNKAQTGYTPYRSFSEFLFDFFLKVPKSSSVADTNYATHIKYKTTYPGVVLPAEQLEKFPDEIVIVLQHQFESLTVLKDYFTVVLHFGGKPTTLAIPFKSITEITIPAIGLRVENYSRDSHMVSAR